MIERINKLPDLSADTPLRPKIGSTSSSIESVGYQELVGGIDGLKGKPRKHVAEMVASLCMETNRVADPYPYLIKENGELLSPVTGDLVKKQITRNDETEEIEYQAFLKTEDWVRGKTEGVLAWISPPRAGKYSVSKIIISEITEQDGKKVLFNRAIVLDINQENCLKFAMDLSNYSSSKPFFTSVDAVRSLPLDLKTNLHWSYVLEELLPSLSLAEVRSGGDIKLKEKIISKSLDYYDQTVSVKGVADLNRFVGLVGSSRMVGDKPSSCPPKSGSAFETMFGSSSLIGEQTFPCPRCERGIPKGKGYTTCPHCGARKEDYGNCD